MTIKLSETQRVHIREILKTKLSHGKTTVVFEKADGTIRVLTATRDKDLLPRSESADNKTRKESVDMIPVFDTDIQEWRGFSIDKLVSINGVKIEHLVKLVS